MTLARVSAFWSALREEDRVLLDRGASPALKPETVEGVVCRLVDALLARGASDDEVVWFLTNPDWGASRLARARGLESIRQTIDKVRRDGLVPPFDGPGYPGGCRDADVFVYGLLEDTRSFNGEGGVRVLAAPISSPEVKFVSNTRWGSCARLRAAVGVDPRLHVDGWKRSTVFDPPLRARLRFQRQEYARGRGPDGQGGASSEWPQWSVIWWPRIAPAVSGSARAAPRVHHHEQIGAAIRALQRRGLLVDTARLEQLWSDYDRKRLRDALDLPPDRQRRFLDGHAETRKLVQAVVAAVGPEGRLRYQVREWGSRLYAVVQSARSAKLGLQSLPKAVRGAIEALPDELLIYVDFASAHFRIAAALSGDERAQAELASGDDGYGRVTEYLACLRPDLPAAQLRKAAKRLTLAWVNHAGAERLTGLAREAGIHTLDAQHLRSFLAELWPRLTAWRAQPGLWSGGHWQSALAGTFWSPLRRAVTFRPDRWEIVHTPRGPVHRPRLPSATYAVLEAIEADVMHLTLTSLHAHRDSGITALLPMHDGLLAASPRDAAPENARRLKELMEASLRAACPGVHAQADIKLTGPRWTRSNTDTQHHPPDSSP